VWTGPVRAGPQWTAAWTALSASGLLSGAPRTDRWAFHVMSANFYANLHWIGWMTVEWWAKQTISNIFAFHYWEMLRWNWWINPHVVLYPPLFLERTWISKTHLGPEDTDNELFNRRNFLDTKAAFPSYKSSKSRSIQLKTLNFFKNIFFKRLLKKVWFTLPKTSS